MYRRKLSRRDLVLRYGRKPLLLTLALVITLSGAIGGTLAWLVDSTAPLTNTFTVGDISITLTETDNNVDGDNDPNTNSYEITPGHTIDKDPLVTVQAGSKDCYVFVKLEKKNNFDSFLSYEIADGWTALDGNPGVYYREYTGTAEAKYPVLKDNKVTCLDTVTKEQLGALTPATYPQLVIYAYAVQRDSSISAISTPAAAWSLHQEHTIAPLSVASSVEPAALASVDAPLTKEEQQQLAWQQFVQ